MFEEENNIEIGNIKKAKKYSNLKVELESFNWKVQLIHFKGGSRRHIKRRKKKTPINVFKRNQLKKKIFVSQRKYIISKNKPKKLLFENIILMWYF